MLTDDETNQLVALLKKREWPLAPPVFHALMEKTISVPIELGVFDREGRILLIHRDDHEFTGWHMPGTVVRDTDSVDTALERLITSELKQAGVTYPAPLGWTEGGRDICATRHSIALLHACELTAEYSGPGQFFHLNELPDDLIEHHKILIPMMFERAEAEATLFCFCI